MIIHSKGYDRKINGKSFFLSEYRVEMDMFGRTPSFFHVVTVCAQVSR